MDRIQHPPRPRWVQHLENRAMPALVGLIPALILLAYWRYGESALAAAALLAPPLCITLSALVGTRTPAQDDLIRTISELKEEAERLSQAQSQLICFACGIPDLTPGRHPDETTRRLRTLLLRRAQQALRADDAVAFGPDGHLFVLIDPQQTLSIATVRSIAIRLQAELAHKVQLGDVTLLPEIAVGISLTSRGNAETGNPVEQALDALWTAQRCSPTGLQVWAKPDASPELTKIRDTEADALMALDSGEITAWFQPQVSTDTGRISGMEALARWNHPTDGTLGPGSFLPALEQANALPQLCDTMLHAACRALKHWDRARLDVPRVGLNLSEADLDDSKLVDRLLWALDKYDLTPRRLSLEILETVSPFRDSDRIARTVRRCKDEGFGIDLDDFGTGHSALAALRRFPVTRVKIDRSFVNGIDRNEDHRRVVAGILGLAEKLNIDTLAEGVEAPREQAILSQLGCGHLQGYCIARPMAPDRIPEWIETHNARLADLPRIPKAAS